eukprot:TRINITY_DN9314_c1_g1_i1.p1 TRINITY_DN9314_c1_g1~~TRINITY_DN9314_c1_g1_i1.p1  ORF type:complete len:653 (+),score=45.55 TRINITY_DN9314_c1_g1_i1:87-2045(+)
MALGCGAGKLCRGVTFGEQAKHAVLLVEFMLMLVGYVGLGGVVLMQLETSAEVRLIESQMQVIAATNLSAFDMKNLQAAGVCNFRTLDDREWDFSGATFFALTVVTTIGYGFVTPLTRLGQAFTFIYSLIGIGLVAHVLQRATVTIVKLIKGFLKWALSDDADTVPLTTGARGVQLTESARSQAISAFGQFDEDSSGTIDRDELARWLATLSHKGRQVHPLVVDYVLHQAKRADQEDCVSLDREGMLTAVTRFYAVQKELPPPSSKKRIVLLSITMLVWMMLWAYFFAKQEGWEWLDGFWYCYVTLSTVGFGDYYPRTTWGRFMAFLFIIPGLTIVGQLITALFAASYAKRYWFLQNAYADGKISEAVLRSQGMLPLAKHRFSSREDLLEGDEGQDAASSATLSVLPLQAVLRHGSERSTPSVAGSGVYTPPPAPLTPFDRINDEIQQGGFVCSVASHQRRRDRSTTVVSAGASASSANPLTTVRRARASSTLTTSRRDIVPERAFSPTPEFSLNRADHEHASSPERPSRTNKACTQSLHVPRTRSKSARAASPSVAADDGNISSDGAGADHDSPPKDSPVSCGSVVRPPCLSTGPYRASPQPGGGGRGYHLPAPDLFYSHHRKRSGTVSAIGTRVSRKCDTYSRKSDTGAT